jgi:hypothetical protein
MIVGVCLIRIVEIEGGRSGCCFERLKWWTKSEVLKIIEVVAKRAVEKKLLEC